MENADLHGGATLRPDRCALRARRAHRPIVGDAREPSVYERLLAGALAQLMMTDPPYGCVIANNVSDLGKARHDNFIMGAGEQSLPEFAMTLLRPAFKNMAKYSAAGAIAYVFMD